MVVRPPASRDCFLEHFLLAGTLTEALMKSGYVRKLLCGCCVQLERVGGLIDAYEECPRLLDDLEEIFRFRWQRKKRQQQLLALGRLFALVLDGAGRENGRRVSEIERLVERDHRFRFFAGAMQKHGSRVGGLGSSLCGFRRKFWNLGVLVCHEAVIVPVYT